MLCVILVLSAGSAFCKSWNIPLKFGEIEKYRFVNIYHRPKLNEESSSEYDSRTNRICSLIEFSCQSIFPLPIFILGDFNLPGIDWKTPGFQVIKGFHHQKSLKSFVKSIKSNQLHQFVHQSTSNKNENTLDFVITRENHKNLVSDIQVNEDYYVPGFIEFSLNKTGIKPMIKFVNGKTIDKLSKLKSILMTEDDDESDDIIIITEASNVSKITTHTSGFYGYYKVIADSEDVIVFVSEKYRGKVKTMFWEAAESVTHLVFDLQLKIDEHYRLLVVYHDLVDDYELVVDKFKGILENYSDEQLPIYILMTGDQQQIDNYLENYLREKDFCKVVSENLLEKQRRGNNNVDEVFTKINNDREIKPNLKEVSVNLCSNNKCIDFQINRDDLHQYMNVLNQTFQVSVE